MDISKMLEESGLPANPTEVVGKTFRLDPVSDKGWPSRVIIGTIEGLEFIEGDEYETKIEITSSSIRSNRLTTEWSLCFSFMSNRWRIFELKIEPGGESIDPDAGRIIPCTFFALLD